jgi:hypothetical protein
MIDVGDVMVQRDQGERDRGLSIVAIVSMVAAGLLTLCILLVVVAVVGVGLFGIGVNSGPTGPAPIVVTPVTPP